ncbi:MAG TPA: hypothetical protein VMP00_07290 [Burkholderiales bacterium]|nr:hypothetical protein [Burkholderiales bacterium]
MSALLGLVQNEAADSSIAFRDRVYRRGEQGELLRDVIALANAAVVGRRFLFLGVVDRPGRVRGFPGITARTWKRFCQVVPAFLERTVEPHLTVTLQSVQVDGALVGALCLDACEDPPYLLARRISPNMPAGGGWVRRGVKLRRLLRDHLQKIFQARFRRQEVGDVTVGFPGELPREELLLPVLPVDQMPSMRAAHKVNRMIEANEVSRAVLGRSDSRIARLVHAQVSGEDIPYREQGTKTMRVKLREIPLEHAAADDHYQFELRAHRLNFLLSNLADKPQTDLVLTLKIPRIEGVGVADRVYSAPGELCPRRGRYPKVDVGPRTIVVQVTGIRIPRRGMVEAFHEPLRFWLRETAAGQTIRVGYVLQGATMAKPVQGRLKIFVID